MHRLKSSLLAALALLGGISIAHGFGTGGEGCAGNCGACHSITKEEAQALVRPFGQDLEVVEVKPSRVRGLYQALFRRGKDQGILYIDYEKKYLISGTVIDAGLRQNITEAELLAGKRLDVSAINLGDALVLGNRAGSKKIYVFTDPECPYCAQMHGELTSLIKEDPDLVAYILLFPLEIHPDAAWKTDSIVCTSRNDMAEALAMLDRSLDRQTVRKVACGKPYAEMGKVQATELGIGMTPTIVLPDGSLALGAKKKEELKKLIAEHPAPKAPAKPALK
jgi:thiol:disulfide interchange protein DsbC